MLSAKIQTNLNNAEKYFKEHLQLGDYYSQENAVAGEWIGIGAEKLGLVGRVKEDQFLKLCHNPNPKTGKLLTQRMKTTRWDADKMATVANRRIFYDFTFSPPKSVSIQALAANDKRLLDGHNRAVQTALKELQHFAGTRVHQGCEITERLSPERMTRPPLAFTNVRSSCICLPPICPASSTITTALGSIRRRARNSETVWVSVKLFCKTQTNFPNDTATDARTKNLTCWRTATNPQCLRVETTGETHLFPYGYFQHAKFIRQNGKEVVQIKFQDQIIFVKEKDFESLCDALERLAVERIKICPEKYKAIARNEGVIEEIEIKKSMNEKKIQTGKFLYCFSILLAVFTTY